MKPENLTPSERSLRSEVARGCRAILRLLDRPSGKGMSRHALRVQLQNVAEDAMALLEYWDEPEGTPEETPSH